ncbi:hypothetical protein H1C71_039388, partial [Ictidomys tridecemlineatus]
LGPRLQRRAVSLRCSFLQEAARGRGSAVSGARKEARASRRPLPLPSASSRAGWKPILRTRTRPPSSLCLFAGVLAFSLAPQKRHFLGAHARCALCTHSQYPAATVAESSSGERVLRRFPLPGAGHSLVARPLGPLSPCNGPRATHAQ